MSICGVYYQKNSLRYILGFLEPGKIVDIILSVIGECEAKLYGIPQKKVEFEFCGLGDLERVTQREVDRTQITKDLVFSPQDF